MTLYEQLINRRSTKCFKADMPSEEAIDRIINAGLYAANGRNFQSPIIIAVTNRELRDRLAQLNAAVMGSDADTFYGAPAVLVVLADRSKPTYVYDGSLTLGNMMLAAEGEGLGSCWIHRAKEVFDTEEGKELLTSLGIEGDYEGIGNLVLGYADGEKRAAPPRRENRVYKVK